MDPVADSVSPVKHRAASLDEATAPVAEAPRYTLIDLQRDFVFFSTGLLYAAIPHLTRDLVKDFAQTASNLLGNSGLGVFDSTGTPFFSGMGKHQIHNTEVDMDRRLYAIRKDVWPACRAFIGGASFISIADSEIYRILLQHVSLMDMAAAAKPGVITEAPVVPVVVFAVNSSQRFVCIGGGYFPPLAVLVQPPKTADDLTNLMEAP